MSRLGQPSAQSSRSCLRKSCASGLEPRQWAGTILSTACCWSSSSSSCPRESWAAFSKDRSRTAKNVARDLDTGENEKRTVRLVRCHANGAATDCASGAHGLLRSREIGRRKHEPCPTVLGKPRQRDFRVSPA